MIAVVANAEQRPVVEEFFELFKTPWEFHQADSDCSVLICAEDSVPANSARLILVYGGRKNSYDSANRIHIRSQRIGAMLSHGKSRLAIHGYCLAFAAGGENVLTHELNGEPAAVTGHSGTQTVVRIGYDLFEEVRQILTFGQPASQASIPSLDLHIALLRDLILDCSIPLVEIPPVPDGHRFIACLTHDLDHVLIRNHKFDHTMFGFLYRATIGSMLDFIRGRKNGRQLATNWIAALKLPLVHLGLAADFWGQLDRYPELERELNSTFFVIPNKGEPGMDSHGNHPARRAASYDVAGLAELLKKLQIAGNEIGLHGIDAWRDEAAGRREFEVITRLTGAPETGVRMHWLFFDEHSPAVLEAAGFDYDATIGYNETVGYRAGTTQVFKPLNVERLLELPLHVMDTALFFPGYLGLSPAQTEEALSPFTVHASRCGGVLTVNWHDRSVAPERLWDTAYVRLLEHLRSSGACFLTAGQTVSWFRKRRTAVFQRNGTGIKIKIPAGEGKQTPCLRVRNYRPSARNGEFVETRLSEGAETCLPA